MGYIHNFNLDAISPHYPIRNHERIQIYGLGNRVIEYEKYKFNKESLMIIKGYRFFIDLNIVFIYS